MGLEEKLAALECEIDNLRRRVAELEFEKAQRDDPMGYVCNHPNCPTRITC